MYISIFTYCLGSLCMVCVTFLASSHLLTETVRLMLGRGYLQIKLQWAAVFLILWRFCPYQWQGGGISKQIWFTFKLQTHVMTSGVLYQDYHIRLIMYMYTNTVKQANTKFASKRCQDNLDPKFSHTINTLNALYTSFVLENFPPKKAWKIKMKQIFRTFNTFCRVAIHSIWSQHTVLKQHCQSV